jgi:hypothetical protein
MAALYDEVCLKTFPIDAAVDAIMASKGATPLTPEEVRVTLVDDPGRGWLLDDGDRKIQVTLELPPFHACSVRAMVSSGPQDMEAYKKVSQAFEDEHRGFRPAAPYDKDIAGLHIHAVGEQRDLPGNSTESLLVFDQRVTDPQRRAAGETAVSLRFVHQIHSLN